MIKYSFCRQGHVHISRGAAVRCNKRHRKAERKEVTIERIEDARRSTSR